MAVSVLFRIAQSGQIEVVDGGPAPAVAVDDDGQLHAESGIVTLRRRRPRRGAMALAVLRRPACLTLS